MTATITADIPSADLPPGMPKRRPRGPDRRPRGKRLLNPAVRPVTVDGQAAVAVQLGGGLGRNMEMILEPDVWAWVEAEFGPVWTVMQTADDRRYVVGGSKRARDASGQRSASPVAPLARLIAGRGELLPGKSVVFRNGDRQDLRAVNLKIVPRRESWNHRPDMPLPEIVDGWA